jgi:hypothetical protein
MTKRTFLVSLLLCNVLTLFIVSIVSGLTSDKTSIWQYLVLFLLGYNYRGIIINVLILGGYFFMTRKISLLRNARLFYSVLIISSLVYFCAVLAIDWSASKKMFVDFKSYLFWGNYYLIYTLIVIIVVTYLSYSTRKKGISC